MKFAIVIPDGCADEPQESLGGKTPLQAARTPAMDEIAATGVVGRSNNVPSHLPAGSDVASLSLLGYDPNKDFTGRAPLEAAAQGIALGPEDWAVRCNLVTVVDQVMRSFTAGQISTPEASDLLKAAQQTLGSANLEFVPGVSYRNLLIYRGQHRPAPFTMETRATPPHDLTDKLVIDDFPRGPGSAWLCDLMARSVDVFAAHPVNVARRQCGKLPATNVWLWGLGRAPRLDSFSSRYGARGTMITAVDLLRGLATLIGWDVLNVPGATGYLDTDYAAKGRYAVDALINCDLVCVHIEATDEASHEGNIQEKIHALESIDEHIVRPLLNTLKMQGTFRILVSPDHPTPVRTKTHSHGFVPFAICGTGIHPGGQRTYDEMAAAKSSLAFEEGFRLMDFFMGAMRDER